MPLKGGSQVRNEIGKRYNISLAVCQHLRGRKAANDGDRRFGNSLQNPRPDPAEEIVKRFDIRRVFEIADKDEAAWNFLETWTWLEIVGIDSSPGQPRLWHFQSQFQIALIHRRKRHNASNLPAYTLLIGRR